MDKGWLFLIVLLLVGVLGFMLRERFFAPEAPFRQWIDRTIGPWAKKAASVLFYATVGIWLVIWATASDDDRTKFSTEFRAFLKSIEWGQKKSPGDQGAPSKDQSHGGADK